MIAVAAGVALVGAPAFAGNKDVLIAPTGITYEVWEQRERTFSGDSANAIAALRFSVIELDTRHEGVVNGTNDVALDAHPRLAFDPSTNEPVLVWSRWDGSRQKIAFSRYSGTNWSSPKIITFGPGDDQLPRLGTARDGEYLFWVSKGDHYMYAPFDLSTGNLLSSARQINPSYANDSSDIQIEEPPIDSVEGGADAPILGGSAFCSRHPNGKCRGRDGGPPEIQEPGQTIQGGSDAPIISIQSQSQLWAVASNRGCQAQVVAVPADDVRSLSILSFHNGTIRLRTRLAVPTPIPDGYGSQAARTFLTSLCY
jgi:hypothetical protein